MLYVLGLEKPKFEGRSQEEIEYERQLPECTFKPDLALTSKSNAAKAIEKVRKNGTTVESRPKMQVNPSLFIKDKGGDSDSRKSNSHRFSF